MPQTMFSLESIHNFHVLGAAAGFDQREPMGHGMAVFLFDGGKVGRWPLNLGGYCHRLRGKLKRNIVVHIVKAAGRARGGRGAGRGGGGGARCRCGATLATVVTFAGAAHAFAATEQL